METQFCFFRQPFIGYFFIILLNSSITRRRNWVAGITVGRLERPRPRAAYFPFIGS